MVWSALNPIRAFAASALLLAGLSGVMVVELNATPEAMSPDEKSAASAAPAALPAVSRGGFALPPLSSFAEVTERPLFSSTRRPATEEIAQAKDGNLGIRLAGIVTSPDASRVIVAHGDPPVLARLKEGDNIDGWSVRLIDANRVVLRRGDEDRQLTLHDVAVQIPVQMSEDAAQAARGRHK
jgi:hypothetical protein